MTIVLTQENQELLNRAVAHKIAYTLNLMDKQVPNLDEVLAKDLALGGSSLTHANAQQFAVAVDMYVGRYPLERKEARQLYDYLIGLACEYQA